jgi:hypothetical protein
MFTPDQARQIALSLPETTVSDHFAAPAFRVGKTIFAILRLADGMTVKLDPEDQRNLREAHPDVVTPVPGKGAREARAALQGWTLVRYASCDAAFGAQVLTLAWSEAAPRRVVEAWRSMSGSAG